MSTEVPQFSLDDLYDLVHQARAENPHDGRTRPGRAWMDGAWAVMQAAYKARDEQRASGSAGAL